MTVPLVLLALLVGATMSVYLPMIARMAALLGSAPLANVPFYALGLVTSIVIAVATGSRAAEFRMLSTLPPWLLLAGVMSAGMIMGSSFLVPRIGIGAFFVLMVSGQVLAGLVFGQLGLFGVPASVLSIGKVGGALMVIGGVWLITFF
ncbi:DMT family transporter [Tropicimonas sp. IMCC6043]|uniref:DMT family transporter n=1 Tax=Tropicimonas sp. IMCC6043 TaxID=2510645 RepID=UPI0013EA9186|nr:DMT family transporter [Tropicimonas sp. IMCC6043]